MEGRPKQLKQARPLEVRKKHQRIMEEARRAIANDLAGYLGALGKGFHGAASILGLASAGRYKITTEQAVKQVKDVLYTMPRPWRSHQKTARVAAWNGRAARRFRRARLKARLGETI